jgi:hypothetical protein
MSKNSRQVSGLAHREVKWDDQSLETNKNPRHNSSLAKEKDDGMKRSMFNTFSTGPAYYSSLYAAQNFEGRDFSNESLARTKKIF